MQDTHNSPEVCAVSSHPQRGTSDLTEDDISVQLKVLDWEGQTQVFIALFYVFGTSLMMPSKYSAQRRR
jgi:hypothetical protein